MLLFISVSGHQWKSVWSPGRKALIGLKNEAEEWSLAWLFEVEGNSSVQVFEAKERSLAWLLWLKSALRPGFWVQRAIYGLKNRSSGWRALYGLKRQAEDRSSASFLRPKSALRPRFWGQRALFGLEITRTFTCDHWLCDLVTDIVAFRPPK